jgi:HPt (histidine-containing phosphotransfer) domain-containing protein
MSGRAVLDPDVVESLRQLTPPGEPDVLGEILSLFLDEVPRKIATLRAAVTSGDAVEVQRIAHSLKGSTGNIGARAMYDVCRQLDDRAKSGEVARLQPLVDALDAEYGRVETEIRRLLSGGETSLHSGSRTD